MVVPLVILIRQPYIETLNDIIPSSTTTRFWVQNPISAHLLFTNAPTCLSVSLLRRVFARCSFALTRTLLMIPDLFPRAWQSLRTGAAVVTAGIDIITRAVSSAFTPATVLLPGLSENQDTKCFSLFNLHQ